MKNKKPLITETNDFALLEFDKQLSELQQKLYYAAASMVEKDEDPEAQAIYRINIREMAEVNDNSPKALRRHMPRVCQELKDMNVGLRSALVDKDGKLHIIFNIFQEVIVDPLDTNYVNVRFNYEIRKKLIEMKKVYDIEYTQESILRLTGKYSIPLYTALIAWASEQRKNLALEEDEIFNEDYVVEVSKEALLSRLNYADASKAGNKFNSRDLPAMCKSVNENTEIFIENGMPEAVRKGRAIKKYIFRYHIKTSISHPVFATSLFDNIDDTIPSMAYLTRRMKQMGVSDSLVKNLKLRYDNGPGRKLIWGNLLYTWYSVGNKPAYFNTAVHEDYFGSTKAPIEKMFRLVTSEKQEFVDDYMKKVDEEYSRRGIPNTPSFIESLIKHLKKKNRTSKGGQ